MFVYPDMFAALFLLKLFYLSPSSSPIFVFLIFISHSPSILFVHLPFPKVFEAGCAHGSFMPFVMVIMSHLGNVEVLACVTSMNVALNAPSFTSSSSSFPYLYTVTMENGITLHWYVFMNIFMYIFIYIYTHTSICICVSMYIMYVMYISMVCMYVYMYICMYVEAVNVV